jgi:hypothetical protein
MIENILNEAIHDILEGDEVDRVFDDCYQRPTCLEQYHLNDKNPPSFSDINNNYFLPEETKYQNQHHSAIEEELKLVSNMGDEEIFKKRMFLEKPFVDLLEFMLEDTIFNLMEEATYEEFDLT